MTTTQTDADAFRRFELASWERVAGRFATSWEGLTERFARPLLAALEVRPGTRLLDVACGTGCVTAAADAMGAATVGVDFSPAMLEQARRRHPGLHFEEGDAEALAFAPASFEVLAMGFGVLHLARPESAFAEASRVLRQGGRFGFTLWAGPEECAGDRIVAGALEVAGDPGDSESELPAGPPAGRFRDSEECRRALGDAGFVRESLTFATHTVAWLLPGPDDLFELERSAGVRTAAFLARQNPERLAAIRDAMREGVARHRTEAGYAIPMTAHIVTARAA